MKSQKTSIIVLYISEVNQFLWMKMQGGRSMLENVNNKKGTKINWRFLKTKGFDVNEENATITISAACCSLCYFLSYL